MNINESYFELRNPFNLRRNKIWRNQFEKFFERRELFGINCLRWRMNADKEALETSNQFDTLEKKIFHSPISEDCRYGSLMKFADRIPGEWD